jgi:transcriptional regulator with XRE-family HTH domain
MDLKKQFAQNVIEQRQNRGLTPKDLARSAEISLDEVESIEAGQVQPVLDQLMKLAGALDVPLGTLAAGLSFDPENGFSVSDG